MNILRSLPLLFSILILTAKVDAGSTESVVYDASTDFSTVSNPNGVWSYGWKSTFASPFNLFTVKRTYLDYGVPVEDWLLANQQIPQIMHSTSTNMTYVTSEGTMPPGGVWMVAGFTGWTQNFSVIRFTVPQNSGGNFLVESAMLNRLSGGSSQDAEYHVVVNNQLISSHFFDRNSSAGYTNEFNLVAGDTIDFLCGRGADGVEYGSGLKIGLLRITGNSVCTPHKARATAHLVNGFLVGATITDTGCGYTNSPMVLIEGGGGFGAVATAVITDGRVTAVQITDAGFGYDSSPRIVIASPPFVPRLSISVSKVQVIQEVTLGRRYVLEASHDSQAWSVVVPAFTAMSESITNEFDTSLTGRFFRVRETQ